MKIFKIILLSLSLLLFTGCTGAIYVDDGVLRNEDGDSILEGNNIPVAIQDQHSATIILPMVQELNESNLTINTIVNSYNVTVLDSTGFTIGDHFRIINSLADRFYFGEITNIIGNIIILDTPLDFVYIAGSQVTVSNINMAVDGSVTPIIFKLRTGDPSIPSEVDITRIIITCQANSAINLNEFCDLPELERGLVFRRINGIQTNIFNIKSNAEITNLAFDFDAFVATNPAQGVDGFVSRLTFAGQNKIGVTLRVDQFGNLEMLVQDDLTGLISLIVVLEGHVVI